MSLVALLLDEFKGTKAETTIPVRLAEEADRLSFSTKTADGLLVGDVERGAGLGCGGSTGT